jgi:predicted HNH restriction endonuclease
MDSINQDFYKKVKKSLKNRKNRQVRLKKAGKQKPKKIAVSVWVYSRNPDVVAEVLQQANGKCGSCGMKAPFRRRTDNTLYLEVHHKKQLARGGEDTVENAIALCPNCHREKHYG